MPPSATPPTEYDTTCRITLPDDPAASVKVLFVPFVFCRQDSMEEFHSQERVDIIILGVFRLDDDAEVDFPSLAQSEQDKVQQACEHAYKQQTKNQVL